ncbi:uncharacterized protein PAC_10190 [Phialocephala subalpina]|uniref:Uncharacterized protein n=1 Tax=Phialocephala subalpina TaxID=576137 RepID=A0A1L7X5K2_9HELO|nr:uncharacterized protein PAC_10190 [Phialocephala subalpina]
MGLLDNLKRKKMPKETPPASFGSTVTTAAGSSQDLSLPAVAETEKPLGINVWSGGESPVVDIVFLHGLTGHREKTWTADKPAEPWPKTLLATDIPNARIITYGYDADVVHWLKPAGQNTVREHAQNLVNDMCGLRARTKTTKQPILFVVHSLGGLVCQDALLLCVNPNEEAQAKLLDAVRGVAFMGTPNAGSDYQKFASAVANIISLTIVKLPTTQLLEVLNARSQVLANIKNGFLTMVRGRLQRGYPEIKIHAFVEELPVTATGHRVVTPDSAVIPGYNSTTIPANHMNMTKFSSRNEIGYERVLGRLMDWIARIEDASDGIKRILIRRHTANDPTVEEAMHDPKLGSRKYYRYPRQATKFIHRPDLISKITNLSSQRGQDTPSVCILHGMGGQGKTALAIDFCRQAETKHLFLAIFWMDASTEEALKKGLIAISDIIKRSPDQTFGSNEERVDFALQMIESWNRPWLLIFDNYDNPDGFRDLNRYIPSTSQGSVLVTSRNSNLARLGTVLEVPPMSLAEAHALLYDRIGGVEKFPNQEEDAIRIVDLLGYLPLAIDQAGAYIQRRVNFTLSRFIEEYNDRKELIWSKAPRAWDYKGVVYTTWEMSFQLIDELEEARSQKGNLLTMLSFLDFRSISQEIFEVPRDLSFLPTSGAVDGIASPKWLQNLLAQNGDWDWLKLEDLFLDFRDLSLLQISGLGPRTLRLSMHPLVSEWIKYRSDIQTKRECLLQAIITVNVCLHAKLLTLERHLLSDDAEQQFLRHKVSCVQNLQEIQRRDSSFLSDLQPFGEANEPQSSADVGKNEIIRTIQNDTSKVSDQVQLLLDNKDLQYDKAVLEWLAPDNSDKLLDNLRLAAMGTGAWFINHAVFQQWAQGKDSELWCFGRAGSGKTVLASLAAEYLSKSMPLALVLLVYCDFKVNNEQQILDIIKSLLRQAIQHTGVVPAQVRECFKRLQSLNLPPALSEIERMFFETLRSTKRAVYTIIDGLDELPGPRTKILEVLRKLTAGFQPARVMVTSRRETDIVNLQTPDTLTISIDGQIGRIDNDIRTFVRQNLKNFSAFPQLDPTDDPLRLEIEELVVRKSQGIFFFAVLFLERLSTTRSRQHLRKACLNSPDSLNDIYQEIFIRISDQPASTAALSYRILAWLAFSGRSMSRREFQHALAATEIEPQDIEFDQEGLVDIDQIIRLGNGFVVVDHQNDFFQLRHFSLIDWLRSRSALLQNFSFPQTRLMHACLSYLSLEPFASGPCLQKKLRDRVLEYPFALYAAEFWPSHAEANEPFMDNDQILEFLKSKKKYESWIQILEYVELSKSIATSRAKDEDHSTSEQEYLQEMDTSAEYELLEVEDLSNIDKEDSSVAELQETVTTDDEVKDVLPPLSTRLAVCQTPLDVASVLELEFLVEILTKEERKVSQRKGPASG